MSGIFRNIDPPPPSLPGECVPQPLVRGEDTLAGWRGGGVSIVRKATDTALYSLCKYFVPTSFTVDIQWNILDSPYSKKSFFVFHDNPLSKNNKHLFNVPKKFKTTFA